MTEEEYTALHGWAANGEKIPPKNIYLMKDRRNRYYKIGVSNNPIYREKTLQAEEPNIILVGDWKQLQCEEKAWHQYFTKERLRGEWFQLTPAQVRFFISKCRRSAAPPARNRNNAIENSPEIFGFITITQTENLCQPILSRSGIYKLLQEKQILGFKHKRGKRPVWLVNYTSVYNYILSHKKWKIRKCPSAWRRIIETIKNVKPLAIKPRQ